MYNSYSWYNYPTIQLSNYLEGEDEGVGVGEGVGEGVG